MIPPSVAKDFVGTDEVGEVRDIGEVHLRLQRSLERRARGLAAHGIAAKCLVDRDAPPVRRRMLSVMWRISAIPDAACQ
jgi:hypothetical protein